MKLSEWIDVDHCATRVILGEDPNDISKRVAFIEKTPRIKVLAGTYAVQNADDIFCSTAKQDAWIEGPKGSDDYGKDTESRAWCDNMLRLLGHELAEDLYMHEGLRYLVTLRDGDYIYDVSTKDLTCQRSKATWKAEYCAPDNSLSIDVAYYPIIKFIRM